MLQWEHSAILSTFIKLPFVIKIFVFSIFEWPLKTGFAVYNQFVFDCHLSSVVFVFNSYIPTMRSRMWLRHPTRWTLVTGQDLKEREPWKPRQSVQSIHLDVLVSIFDWLWKLKLKMWEKFWPSWEFLNLGVRSPHWIGGNRKGS